MGATSANIEATSSGFGYQRSRCVSQKRSRYAFRSGSCMAREELPSNSRRYSQGAPAVGTFIDFVEDHGMPVNEPVDTMVVMLSSQRAAVDEC